jgi:hypothetical protein
MSNGFHANRTGCAKRTPRFPDVPDRSGSLCQVPCSSSLGASNFPLRFPVLGLNVRDVAQLLIEDVFPGGLEEPRSRLGDGQRVFASYEQPRGPQRLSVETFLCILDVCCALSGALEEAHFDRANSKQRHCHLPAVEDAGTVVGCSHAAKRAAAVSTAMLRLCQEAFGSCAGAADSQDFWTRFASPCARDASSRRSRKRSGIYERRHAVLHFERRRGVQSRAWAICWLINVIPAAGPSHKSRFRRGSRRERLTALLS